MIDACKINNTKLIFFDNTYMYPQDDFEEGIMYFIAPHQVLQFDDILLSKVRGFVLVLHPDFLHGYGLASSIKDYGYFSYTANEALHLSEKEEKTIFDIIANVEQEIDINMDYFTQDLLVSNPDLLLKYCDRYVKSANRSNHTAAYPEQVDRKSKRITFYDLNFGLRNCVSTWI